MRRKSERREVKGVHAREREARETETERERERDRESEGGRKRESA